MSDELRPDIEAALGKMSTKLGSKREIRKLPEHLWEGERVDRIVSGMYGSGVGIIVLTDRRLFFLKDGRLSKTSEDFPLDKISSVQWSTGMMMGKITIFASGNKAEIESVPKADGKAMTDTVRGLLAAPSPPTSAPGAPQVAAPASAAEDVYEQLRKLGDLRSAGILTDDEFNTKKADLLSRI